MYTFPQAITKCFPLLVPKLYPYNYAYTIYYFYSRYIF